MFGYSVSSVNLRERPEREEDVGCLLPFSWCVAFPVGMSRASRLGSFSPLPFGCLYSKSIPCLAWEWMFPCGCGMWCFGRISPLYSLLLFVCLVALRDGDTSFIREGDRDGLCSSLRIFTCFQGLLGGVKFATAFPFQMSYSIKSNP